MTLNSGTLLRTRAVPVDSGGFHCHHRSNAVRPSMLQTIVFELAVLIGIAGHFSSEPAIRGAGWVLMIAFIVMGFFQAGVS